jgi:cytochrome c553
MVTKKQGDTMNKLYLSIVTAALLLSGCGDKEQSTQKTETATPAAAVASTTQEATSSAKEAVDAVAQKVEAVVEPVTEEVAAVVETTQQEAQTLAEKATVAAKEVAEQVEAKTEAVKEAVVETPPKEEAAAPVANASGLYAKCIGCHGAKGEKVALGKSKIINAMSSADIETALNGYKDGSYGGPMKGVMKGQVSTFSPEEIKALSGYISTLKP